MSTPAAIGTPAVSTDTSVSNKPKTRGNGKGAYPISQFTFGKKAVAPTADDGEGIAPVETQGTSVSISAPPSSRQLVQMGGIPSSPAFTAAQAQENDLFNTVAREKSIALSSQARKDGLLANASPMPPVGFAVAPAGAARTLSRTASLANDLGDSPSADLDGEGEDDPVLFADYAEVAKHFHFASASSPKVGPRGGVPKKGVEENPKTSVVRLGGNLLRLGADALVVKKQVGSMELAHVNDMRRIRNELQRMESELAGLRDNGAIGGVADPRVAAHDVRIEHTLSDLRALTSTLFADDGSPLFASTQDVQGLWEAMQTALDLVDDQIKELVAEGTAEQTAELRALRAKVVESEADLLVVRAKLAQTQSDVARHILACSTVVAPSVTTAAAAAPTVFTAAHPTTFTVGSGKGVKRKSATELSGPAGKRPANGKPSKAAFHHWVRMSGVDAQIGAVSLFKQLLVAVLPGHIMPDHYVDRVAGVLSVGFETAGDATVFVDLWTGAYNTMPKELKGVRATHAMVAGPSNFAHLAGN
ncbi:hypothetical protein C8R43DRAFT_439839 [Mycena crocata]|nr:hypothetical protein C8R43DRAFT_439839 [Mycena crocata]